MPQLDKPLALKWKTIEGIARALKLAPTHVYLVSKAQRQGREDLIAALEQAQDGTAIPLKEAV
jgi:hypothetical protein